VGLGQDQGREGEAMSALTDHVERIAAAHGLDHTTEGAKFCAGVTIAFRTLEWYANASAADIDEDSGDRARGALVQVQP
jgi:hypothetical protein